MNAPAGPVAATTGGLGAWGLAKACIAGGGGGGGTSILEGDEMVFIGREKNRQGSSLKDKAT